MKIIKEFFNAVLVVMLILTGIAGMKILWDDPDVKKELRYTAEDLVAIAFGE